MLSPSSKFAKSLSVFLTCILLNSTIGCNYYYTYRVDSSPTMAKIDQLKNSPNYIIIHQADVAYHLVSVKIDQQEQTLSGTLQALGPDHYKYLETKSRPGSSNRYQKKTKGSKIGTPLVINEVHFYLKDISLRLGEEVSIPLSSIEKIEVYDPDTGATTASHILGGIGILAGTFIIIGIIVALTKSSCPFVYVNNGEEYVFAGEIYSGAIFRSIERNDYLLLPTIKSENVLEMKVANKLKEQQFINQLGLMQVSHPAGTHVLPDRKGNVHLITNPVKMTKAMVDDRDITQLLQQHDSTHFTFNVESGDSFFNDVTITFPRTSQSKDGHLILHAKNSLWGDYLFGEFTKLFGSRYSAWIEKQNARPTDETARWAVDQGLAMKVFIEIDNEWKFVDYVDLVGPLGFRDVLVPVELTDHHSETLRIKLSSGFMMWDLDYVAMDYSADAGMGVKYIAPSEAVTNGGDDVLALLNTSDAKYLAQKITGDEVMVSFPISKPVEEGIAYDYILHARGYYQHVRDYDGPPEITTLWSFKLPGRFSRFSKEKYDEMNQILQVAEISASIKN